jgi:hypothetical protein
MRRNGVMVPMIACVVVEPIQMSAGPWKGPPHPQPVPEWGLEASVKVVDMFEFIRVVSSSDKWGGRIVWLKRIQPGVPTAGAEAEARAVEGMVGRPRYASEAEATRGVDALQAKLDRSGDARKMVAYARKMPGGK